MLEKRDGNGLRPAVFKLREARERASREVQVASSGSPTTLFIPEAAQQDWLPEKTRGHIHTHEINPADIHTIGRGTVMCRFCFFGEARLKREVPYVTGSATCLLYYMHIFRHNNRTTGYTRRWKTREK